MKSINFLAEMKALMSIGHANSLINDDNGHWAVVSDGTQSVCWDGPCDAEFGYFIEKDKWRDSPEEALERYLSDCFDDDPEAKDETTQRFLHNRDVFIRDPKAAYDYEKVLI